MNGRISQIELVTGIMSLLDNHGIKTLHAYQMNAVVAGANLIMKDLQRPFVPAKFGMGLPAWLQSDDTGVSSRYMAHILAGGPMADYGHPHDPDDFGRCHRFLEAVPGTRPRLRELAERGGRIWAALVEAWEELTVLYTEETPTGKAPRLYARMREIIAQAESKDEVWARRPQ